MAHPSDTASEKAFGGGGWRIIRAKAPQRVLRGLSLACLLGNSLQQTAKCLLLAGWPSPRAGEGLGKVAVFAALLTGVAIALV